MPPRLHTNLVAAPTAQQAPPRRNGGRAPRPDAPHAAPVEPAQGSGSRTGSGHAQGAGSIGEQASDGLAGFLRERLPELTARWETAAVARMPHLTPVQRLAVAEAVRRMATACVEYLATGAPEALAGTGRWLARSGAAGILAGEQIEEVLGCFHEAAWPLAVCYAGGDWGHMAALAAQIADCAVALVRAASAECRRRIMDEANDTAEFGFTLAEVSRSVSASLNLDEVLQAACQEGARLLGAEAALVCLFDERGQLVCRAAWGENATCRPGALEPVCTRAVRSGRVQTCAIEEDGPPARMALTCLAAPIVAKGQVLGAMAFVVPSGSARADASRGLERAVTAELLVSQVGLTIYNAQLHTQVRELAYALDHIAECLLVTEADGRIRYANRAVLPTLGHEPGGLIGRSIGELWAEGDPGTVWGSDRGTPEEEVFWRHRNGHTVPVALTVGRVDPAEGAAARRVVLARDITERKRREEQEAAYRAALQTKNRELECFVYTVSHDLRAPLVSLHGLLGVLRSECGEGLSDTGRHVLERLDANVLRMERLIEDLLQLSRVGRQAQQADIDTGVIVSEVLEDWRHRLDARGISVEVRGPLPVVRADRTSLRQVFENLIGNAAKFVGDTPVPRIEIGGEAVNGQAHLFVRDNGIGIAPQHHERVFDIFQRAHDLPGVDGTGIGLAIVKKAVESWDGRVWIESDVGLGCTVHILVPSGGSQQEHGCREQHAAD